LKKYVKITAGNLIEFGGWGWGWGWGYFGAPWPGRCN